ncbi:MAG: hypothetical protein IJW79_01360 [Clostridia bacterium]|nr:hypothetical protein [Clostridia bacterium]
MNAKKLLALLLTVVMLVSALPLGVFAAEETEPVTESTTETTAYESQDYYWKLDFNKATVSDTATTVFDAGKTDPAYNPYGFGLSGATNLTKAYVKKRAEGDNYVHVAYDIHQNSSWRGAQISVGKDGMSASVFNTISFEMDFRWQGYAYTTDEHTFTRGDIPLVQIRRYANNPYTFIMARERDNGDLNLYVNKMANANFITTIKKGAEKFTNIKVVYYDITQTYSIYIDGVLVAEGKTTSNDYRSDSYVTSTFEQYDMFNTSREQNPTSNPYITFQVMRLDYGTKNYVDGKCACGVTTKIIPPIQFDIDNLIVRNYDIKEGVTPYYENTFDATFSGLVDGAGGNAYTWHKLGSQYTTNDGTFCVSKGTYTGNTYVDVEPGGRFNLKDVYQFVQDGNYVIEFNARATSAGNNPLLRMHTGSDTQAWLTVDQDGYLYLSGIKTTAQITAHKDAEGNIINQDQWTKIALAVTVDKGGAAIGKISNYLDIKANDSLRYQLALFVDGDLVAVNGDVTRAEFLRSGSTGSNFKLLDDREVTKKAVTEEPAAATLATYTKLDYVRTINTDNKAYYYYDTATGDIYQLQYDADGVFVPGTVSEGVGTGSIWLDVTGTNHADVIGFFNNNDTSEKPGSNISGAVDNLKIYSGVIPLDYASTPSETTGVLAEVDFTKFTASTYSGRKGCVMGNYKGGDTGVALLGSWHSDKVTNNEGYSTYTMTANSETYFDIFTQNMGGKIFSVELTVRNLVPSANLCLFKLRRQESPTKSNYTSDLLYVTPDGDLYYTANSTNYFLCDKDGNRYNVGGETWMTPEAIVDETGTKALVTYLVNGEVAYSVPQGAATGTVPTMAALVEGVVSATVFGLRNAIDQRVRYVHTGGNSYFCTDIKNIKAEYTTLPEIVQQAQGYYEVEASEFGGGLYSAKIDLKNFDKGYDVKLLMPMRQVTVSTPTYSFETLYAEATTGYLFFKHDNGYKHYLVNEHRERFSVTGSTAVNAEVIFDERGDKTLVTFLVDGEVAYYDNGEGLVSASNLYIGGDVVHALKNGAVQKLRFYNVGVGEDAAFADNSTALVQAVDTVPEADEITWADELRVDFSEYESIDELLAAYNGQIEVTGAVTLENGLLHIPSGGSVRWIDYNGTFISYGAYEMNAVNGQYVNGYTIEFIGNVNVPSKRGLLQLDRCTLVDGELVSTLPSIDNFIWVNKNDAGTPTFHLTGGTNQYYPLNPVGSDTYNNISITLPNSRSEGNVFVDGHLLGRGAMTNFNNDAYSSGKITKIIISGEAELKELRIHCDVERELAKESGNIFTFDVDDLCLKYDTNTLRWTNNGIMDGGLLLKKTVSTQETYTDAETGESFKYFKVAPTTALGGQDFSEIWLNGYLEDKITVFEYDFRFKPGEGVTTDAEMAALRRADDNSTTAIWDFLFDLKPNANYEFMNKFVLCDAEGIPFVASAENWNKLAIIYDANAGLVSYVLDGKVPYYMDGEELKLAQNIQLPASRNYRMDSAETKLRTLGMFAGSTHRVDLAKLNIYTVDGTANAGYVGAQIDTTDNNIRLTAGVDMLYYGRVGFDVVAIDSEGIHPVKSYDRPWVYSSIKETVDGKEQNVYPESYGYRYFYTANIMDVTEDEAVKLIVTPYTKINGVKYSSSTTVLDVDFSTGTVDTWTLEKRTNEFKPEGDNVNANFSITDIVKYTNDGALEFNGLDAKFGFAAELDACVASVNITNAFGEVAENTVLDIYVDNVLVEEGLAVPFGHHTIDLGQYITDFTSGETYEFVIVKRSGGDFVCINNMSVCGTLATPPAIAKQRVVEVVVEAPESGAGYGHVRVYVPTSDGKYYIRYNFNYLNYGLDTRTTDSDASNDPTYSSGGGNTHWNCHMYRIIAADLCEKAGNSYTKKFGLLQTGEISVAMKEALNGTNATDFSGGFHGDENFVSLKFLIDGEELDTTKSGTYTGITAVEFLQESIIDRCNEPDTPILYHNQHFLVDTNGLRIDRHLEVLADNFSPHHSNGYTMMATVYRIGEETTKLDKSLVDDADAVAAAAETFNIKTLKVLNANGELADDTSTFDMREAAYVYWNGGETSTQCAADSSAVNRYAENTGDKGVYARVGFVIGDASMQPKTVRVDVRLSHGDNKWYAAVGSYNTSNNGDIVPKGEKWNLSTYYFVDYNSANIPTAE